MSEQKVREFIENTKFPASDEKVEVGKVGDNRYRVNIWQSEPKVKITQSYYIKVTESGVFDLTA